MDTTTSTKPSRRNSQSRSGSARVSETQPNPADQAEHADEVTGEDREDREEHFQGRWLGSLGGLAFFAGVSFAAAAIGARITTKPKNKFWYRLLRKSDYTPPDRVFSIVWPVLYSLGAFSAWRVARTEPSATRTKALALWGAQIAANAAWSPLFFGAHMQKLAMADLGANYVSLGAYAYEARKLDTLAFVSVLPTMGWLTFAGTLNGTILMKRQLPGL